MSVNLCSTLSQQWLHIYCHRRSAVMHFLHQKFTNRSIRCASSYICCQLPHIIPSFSVILMYTPVYHSQSVSLSPFTHRPTFTSFRESFFPSPSSQPTAGSQANLQECIHGLTDCFFSYFIITVLSFFFRFCLDRVWLPSSFERTIDICTSHHVLNQHRRKYI